MIPVEIVVTKTTQVFAEARDRALELIGVLEDVLRDHITLRSEVFEAWIAGGEFAESGDDTQRQCSAEVRVFVRAFITG